MSSSFVATNLVHQQLWHDVTSFERGAYRFCEGYPPQKIHPDDPSPPPKEIVLESRTGAQWTVAQWAEVFSLIEPATRLVMAMVTDDSTVVYYVVYKGLQVPRKN